MIAIEEFDEYRERLMRRYDALKGLHPYLPVEEQRHNDGFFQGLEVALSELRWTKEHYLERVARGRKP